MKNGTSIRKTLRGAAADLVSHYSALNPPVFQRRDAQTYLAISTPSLDSLIQRLLRQGWISRLKSGTYLVNPIWSRSDARYVPDRYESLVSWLEPPYYVGFLSALELLGGLQHPILGKTYVVFPTVRRRPTSAVGKIRWVVMAMPGRFDWGIEQQWGTGPRALLVSDWERTILDSLNRPKYAGGIATIFLAIANHMKRLDASRMIQYVGLYKSEAVARRLGWLLSQMDDAKAKIICQAIPDMNLSGRLGTPPLLDPSLPYTGAVDRQWDLRINISPRELAELLNS